MLVVYLQIVINNDSHKKTIIFKMKHTNKKLKNQSKVVKAFFTGSNITKYSGINTFESIGLLQFPLK